MLIVFWNTGQLGNRLFYFSHFIAFAAETKSKLLCLFFGKDAKHYSAQFEGTKSNLVGYFPKPFIPTASSLYRFINWILYKLFLIAKRFKWNNKFISIYTPSIEGKQDSESYSVKDFIDNPARKKSLFTFYNSYISWYDNTDLYKYHKTITNYFVPIEPHRTNIAMFDFKLRNEYPEAKIVGVHIRRGDYREWADGMWYFDDDGYAAQMRMVEKQLLPHKTIFVICSNEEVNLANYQNLTIRKSTGHFIEDMYILSECDYILGPHSTYSMWASFYGQKPLYKMRKNVAEFSISDFKICNGRFYEPTT
jgi:hypothetical protein